VPQFEALGVKVIGLSIDHKFAQKAFAEKLELNFPLVADPNREVSRTLGTLLPEVAGIKEVNVRTVLIVSPELEVRWTFGVDVSTQPNVGEVLEQTKKILTVA